MPMPCHPNNYAFITEMRCDCVFDDRHGLCQVNEDRFGSFLFKVMCLDVELTEGALMMVNFACQLDWINKYLKYLKGSSDPQNRYRTYTDTNSQHKGDLLPKREGCKGSSTKQRLVREEKDQEKQERPTGAREQERVFLQQWCFQGKGGRVCVRMSW